RLPRLGDREWSVRPRRRWFRHRRHRPRPDDRQAQQVLGGQLRRSSQEDRDGVPVSAVEVGQTWCYEGATRLEDELFLITKIEEGRDLNDTFATVVNLETGEAFDCYPIVRFTQPRSFWR